MILPPGQNVCGARPPLTMKTLFLVRHAKSNRDDPGVPDHDRPLNARGQRQAPEMGRRLAGRNVKPDVILSSPALRALTTAQLVAGEIGYATQDIAVDERLYASSAESLLSVVRALDDKLGSAMVFGHNPEMSELASGLSDGNLEMPTCAVAEFRYDTKSWGEVGAIAPAKVTLDTPKT